MKYHEILKIASNHLQSLSGKTLDILDIAKPTTLEYAEHLAKTVSKFSPFMGNMIEYNVCEELNKIDWKGCGNWIRQDPGFPDTIFEGNVSPTPGIEIKTWFPLATEITARFKDSINHFNENQTNVALVAWIPEFIIYGKPKIIAVWVGSAKSLAEARDKHYNNPPDYIVFEPGDTSKRTANLQQTNTNGFKFQGSPDQFNEAVKFTSDLGIYQTIYSSDSEYQDKLNAIFQKFPYRSDTNFAKIDRIQHEELEKFKTNVLTTSIFGHSLKHWSKLINDKKVDTIEIIKDLM
jgi:hypothetical protein